MESGYVYVAGASEISVGKMKKVIFADNEVLIVNVNGNYFAVGSMCTHYGGDLSLGVLEGNIIECPNHKARFDVTTGKVVAAPVETLARPDIEDLPTYLVKVENEELLLGR